MTNILLYDNPQIRVRLLPLTFTRPISHLLCGALTLREKWEKLIPGQYSYLTADYLSEKYPATVTDDNLVIAAHLIPTAELCAEINRLLPGEKLLAPDESIIAWRGSTNCDKCKKEVTSTVTPTAITRPYHLFLFNDAEIRADISLIAPATKSKISPTCCVIGNPDHIYIAPDATVEGAYLNTTHGPIYIASGAEVMEGSCLRGPIAILDHSTVNMGTKIYGATTIGAHCKVGGELNNVVIHPYSNKAHDGFLGNAVIGSWCNLGAGCVASNLKNDYTEIKLWDYDTRRFARTGLQFCGLIAGDHSKAGINTMFNTATVIGVGVNIHGTGFVRNFVASFSEGSATGLTDVTLDKFFKIAERVMARRDIELTDTDRRIFTAIHTLTESLR
ncbi:MAG: glucose-1-phosphate thymidylyltransferase [Paramuribaculum sp.]|nr:glucose-1-phosphate thymidylyltransferase [Paramuribaculum sp.]